MVSSDTTVNSIKMEDKRRDRIKMLKNSIKTAQDNMTELLGQKIDETLTPEEQSTAKVEKSNKVAENKAWLTTCKDELKAIRMNKYWPNATGPIVVKQKDGTELTYPRWAPHAGMNRQQARQFRKMKGELMKMATKVQKAKEKIQEQNEPEHI